MDLKLALGLLTVLTLDLVRAECDGVIMDGVYHEKELLKTNLNYPFGLVVDYSYNMLYLSVGFYYNGSAAQLDLDTKCFQIIDNVPGGWVQAVDQRTHTVYIGGSRGLFKYNPLRKISQRISSEGIESVFFKDTLYYSTYVADGNRIHIIKEKPELLGGFEDKCVYKLAVDRDNDVIFHDCTQTLRRQSLNTTDDIFLGDVFGMVNIGTNVFGEAYVTWKDGIYRLNKCDDTIFKVLDVSQPRSVVFDKNNRMIYSDEHSIYRLTPNAARTSVCEQ